MQHRLLNNRRQGDKEYIIGGWADKAWYVPVWNAKAKPPGKSMYTFQK